MFRSSILFRGGLVTVSNILLHKVTNSLELNQKELEGSATQGGNEALKKYCKQNPSAPRPWPLTSGNSGSPGVAGGFDTVARYAASMAPKKSGLTNDEDTYRNQLDEEAQRVVSRFGEVPGQTIVRAEVAKWLNEQFATRYSQEDIIVTNGAKEALANVFSALLKEGDEVIMRERNWCSYVPQINYLGGEAVALKGSGMCETITVTDLEKYMENRDLDQQIILIWSFVTNPDGVQISEKQFKDIAEFLAKYKKAVILHDSSYDHFYGIDLNVQQMLDEAGFDSQNYIHVWGSGKSATVDHFIRAGGIASKHPELINRITDKISQFSTHVSGLSQACLYGALKDPHRADHVKQYIEFCEEKLALFHDKLNDVPYLTQTSCSGGYAYLKIADEAFKNIDHLKVSGFNRAETLFLRYTAIRGIGGSAFGPDDQNYIRLNLAELTMVELEQVANNIKKGFDLRQQHVENNIDLKTIEQDLVKHNQKLQGANKLIDKDMAFEYFAADKKHDLNQNQLEEILARADGKEFSLSGRLLENIFNPVIEANQERTK